MEIADLSQSVPTRAMRGTSPATTSAAPRIAESAEAAGNRVRALDALRVELRATLTARFSAGFARKAPAFAPFDAPARPEDVADEALQAARQVADANPGRARRALVALRASIGETVDALRDTFSGRRDARDLDVAGRLINRGIDELESGRTGDAVASTRVLEVDSKVRERSAIRIRTQEGDVVTIRLRNVERLSASDTVVKGADGEATRTRVAVSQSSRASFSVEGDLNAAERAAIEDVVAQASEIADEFFGGDLSAAFENAAEFDFDASQLRRVSLRFRFEELTRASYSERISREPEPSQPVTIANPAGAPVRPRTEPESVINRPAPVSASAPVPVEPAAPVQPVEPAAATDEVPAEVDAARVDEVAEPAAPGAPASVVNADAINQFFTFVADFLQQSNIGFETDGESGRFFFSESFRLTLLRETLATAAPEGKDAAARTAADVVDKLVDVTATADAEGDGDDA